MKPYHKIENIWKRDQEDKSKLINGAWTLPVFKYLENNNWDAYEKVDGTNVRVIYRPDEFGGEVSFAGRKDLTDGEGNYKLPNFHPKLWEVLIDKFQPGFFTCFFDLEKSGDSEITLYGEGFGEKIQNGGYGSPSFCLFDIMIGGVWMEQDFVSQLAASSGLQRAPLLASMPLADIIADVRHGFDSSWGNFPAEGVVVRPPMELQDRFGRRVIAKIKTKDLLKVNLRPFDPGMTFSNYEANQNQDG
jgi:hypothetical protein